MTQCSCPGAPLYFGVQSVSPSRCFLAFATRGSSGVPMMMVSRSSSGDDFWVMRPHMSKDVSRVAIADNVAPPAAYLHPNTKVRSLCSVRRLAIGASV